MFIKRRSFITATLPALSFFAFTSKSKASAPSSNFASIRALGNPNAKVRVQEWFSITCAHCANFAQITLPRVKEKWINTGKIYYIFKDFPLDKVALSAAIIARSLPPDQYESFIMVLLNNLDKWAFANNINPITELQKYATIIGISPQQYQELIHDQSLQKIILQEVKEASQKYKINSTPTFIFNEKPLVGELTFENFSDHVNEALKS